MANKHLLWTIRDGVFGFVLFCTFLILGLSANAVSKYGGAGNFGFGTTPTYASLSLAVSIITLVSLTPLVVIDFLRRGAITSWVMVELAVTGVLWVLWLAAAALSVDASPFRLLSESGIDGGCSAYDNIRGLSAAERELIKEFKSLCQQQQALQAFGFLGWLALMGYFFTLLTFAIIAMNRGNKTVWQSSVRETDFSAQSAGSNVAMKQQHQVQQVQAVYPQQTYTPTSGYAQTPMSMGPGQYPQQQQQLQTAPVQYNTPQV